MVVVKPRKKGLQAFGRKTRRAQERKRAASIKKRGGKVSAALQRKLAKQTAAGIDITKIAQTKTLPTISKKVIKAAPLRAAKRIVARVGPTKVRAEKRAPVKITTKQALAIIREAPKTPSRIQVGKFVSGTIVPKKESRLEKAERIVSTKIKTKELAIILKRGRPKSFVGRVGKEIAVDILQNPIKNTALILAGLGIGKAVQLGRLGLSKIAVNSPRLAKTLGVTGKAAAAAATTIYAVDIVRLGNKEFKQTGQVSKTTAKALREITLLGAGQKVAGIKLGAKTTNIKSQVLQANKLLFATKAGKKKLRFSKGELKRIGKGLPPKRDISGAKQEAQKLARRIPTTPTVPKREKLFQVELFTKGDIIKAKTIRVFKPDVRKKTIGEKKLAKFQKQLQKKAEKKGFFITPKKVVTTVAVDVGRGQKALLKVKQLQKPPVSKPVTATQRTILKQKSVERKVLSTLQKTKNPKVLTKELQFIEFTGPRGTLSPRDQLAKNKLRLLIEARKTELKAAKQVVQQIKIPKAKIKAKSVVKAKIKTQAKVIQKSKTRVLGLINTQLDSLQRAETIVASISKSAGISKSKAATKQLPKVTQALAQAQANIIKTEVEKFIKPPKKQKRRRTPIKKKTPISPLIPILKITPKKVVPQIKKPLLTRIRPKKPIRPILPTLRRFKGKKKKIKIKPVKKIPKLLLFTPTISGKKKSKIRKLKKDEEFIEFTGLEIRG